MRARECHHRNRQGFSLAELVIVSPAMVFSLVGVFVAGVGVLRYNQLSMLAREGARWASVHGPTYQSENNKTAPTSQDVYNNAIVPRLGGLDSSNLTCSLTMTSQIATVTLNYQWVPEALFSPITFSSTSIMPITY
jgi:hypothetical protein